MVKKAFLKTFLELETADTPEERRKGLQHRQELDEYTGMLFDFREPAKQSMWMKDTFIPLDIIFLNEQGKVINIEQGIPESSEQVFSASNNCRYVLELKQGKAEDFNISEGTDLSFLV